MAEPDNLPEGGPPKDDALNSLRRRVSAASGQGGDQAPPPNAASLALKMGGEFGAAVLVGAAVGFAIDHFAHTAPWGLGVGLILGFAAGVMNVVRAAQSYSSDHPVDPNTPSIPDDEDD